MEMRMGIPCQGENGTKNMQGLVMATLKPREGFATHQPLVVKVLHPGLDIVPIINFAGKPRFLQLRFQGEAVPLHISQAVAFLRIGNWNEDNMCRGQGWGKNKASVIRVRHD